MLDRFSSGRMSRRTLLKGSTALAAASLLPASGAWAATPQILKPAQHRVQLLPSKYPETTIWAYGENSPGPELRLKQGERLQVKLENGLDQPTTIHWHGLRLPNAMDGVPGLTQDPVEPGESFTYDFVVPDAGTYWYHPHVNSSEQIGRGLYGALIVEEPNPPKVDRDIVWILDDWRMKQDGTISDDFVNGHDISHGGRTGNYITINGKVPAPLSVRKNERIRLRLINVANARIFGVNFENHDVKAIAIDGHPVEPHSLQYDMALLASGQRMDIILDCTGETGSTHRVLDIAYQNQERMLTEIVYEDTEPARPAPMGEVPSLPANPLSEPDLKNAARHDMVITGGAMGGLQGAVYKGEFQPTSELVKEMKIWALNGVAAHTTAMLPMFAFDKGSSHIISVKNDSVFPHPMHLHGHAFRILKLDDKPVPHAPWADTVLLLGNGTAEIALVADNPGDWLFHCHILAHVQGGMSSVIRVT